MRVIAVLSLALVACPSAPRRDTPAPAGRDAARIERLLAPFRGAAAKE